MAEGGDEQRRTLRDFVTPRVRGFASSIAHPNIEANNFELKPALISMVQHSQFGGSPLEVPNLHPSIFLEVWDILKLNRASTNVIRLRLFPFSLKVKARARLYSLPPGHITTSDELTRAVLAKFFPPSETTSLRMQITNFIQKDDETIYKAWERFERFVAVVPSPWPSAMDDYSNFLQWSDPTYKVHY